MNPSIAWNVADLSEGRIAEEITQITNKQRKRGGEGELKENGLVVVLSKRKKEKTFNIQKGVQGRSHKIELRIEIVKEEEASRLSS